MGEHAQVVGWYRDPGQPRLHRYWDGGAWRPPPTEDPERHGFAPTGGPGDTVPAPVVIHPGRCEEGAASHTVVPRQERVGPPEVQPRTKGQVER